MDYKIVTILTEMHSATHPMCLSQGLVTICATIRWVRRESSHGTKELLNLLILVLKAKTPKWLCLLHLYDICMASPRLGLFLEDKPFEPSCTYMYMCE